MEAIWFIKSSEKARNYAYKNRVEGLKDDVDERKLFQRFQNEIRKENEKYIWCFFMKFQTKEKEY